MRIGIHVGHWEGRPNDVAELAVEAERVGFDSVWTSETWGSDAAILAAWMVARTERIGVGTGVLQMAGRTPAAAAMTALTLDHLSAGRFRLGLGVSGPQVAEGWHGTSFDHPLERTREYVGIVRDVLRRGAQVTSPGPHYPLPLPGGAGRPLKPNVRALRPDLPVYLAAMGPRNVALAAEIADGWMPYLYSPERSDVFADALEAGRSRGGRDPSGFDVAPVVAVAFGQDVGACRRASPAPRAVRRRHGFARRELLQRRGHAVSGSATRPNGSRRRSWRAAEPRRPGSCPTAWSTSSAWPARSNAFASAWTPGVAAASPRCLPRPATWTRSAHSAEAAS